MSLRTAIAAALAVAGLASATLPASPVSAADDQPPTQVEASVELEASVVVVLDDDEQSPSETVSDLLGREWWW